ncbi:MAG: radical SAM protein [Myxococcales bacterium]
MKVLLISANHFQVPYPVFPLGLDYVAGAIAPHQARILDLCPTVPDAEARAIAEAVGEFAPDVVGISLRNIDNTDASDLKAFMGDMRRVVDSVRGQTRAPVVLGGAGYTLFPSELLEALGADYGVVGEGEWFKGLLDALEAGGGRLLGAPPKSVAARGRPAPQPVPFMGRIRRSAPELNPLLPWYLRYGGMLSLQTQRGCPFRCAYCTYPTIEGAAARPLDLEQVASTARALQDAGARFLFITDSTFNADPQHGFRVAGAFKKAGLSVPWSAFFTPVPMPDGYYEALAEAGCTHVEFGTDTLCDEMLARDQKPFRFADVQAAHAAARKAGLFVAHFMLFGGPGETSQTVQEALDRCETLPETAFFFFCGMRIYPDTDLHRLALAEGQISPGQNLLEPVFYKPQSLSTDEITRQVVAHARGRPRFVVGGGGERFARLQWRQYERGNFGPLWERLT